MLSPEQVRDVERLLADGRHSQRAIAKMTGVSRGTIGAIANGTRRIRDRSPKEPPVEQDGPVVRCPRCGARTRMPCIACHVRAEAKPGETASWRLIRATPIELNLRDRHRERYEEVRRRRRMNGDPARPVEDGFARMSPNDSVMGTEVRNA